MTKKDVEIILLKAKLAQATSERSGSTEVLKLKEENEKHAQEIKSLTQQLFKAHQDFNAKLTMLIQSYTPKSSSS